MRLPLRSTILSVVGRAATKLSDTGGTSAHSADLAPVLTLRHCSGDTCSPFYLYCTLVVGPPVFANLAGRWSASPCCIKLSQRFSLSFSLTWPQTTDDGFFLSLDLTSSLSLSYSVSCPQTTDDGFSFSISFSLVDKRLTIDCLALFLTLSRSLALALSFSRSLALALSLFVSSHRCTDDVLCLWFSVSVSVSVSLSHCHSRSLTLSLSLALLLSHSLAISLSRSLALALSLLVSAIRVVRRCVRR